MKNSMRNFIHALAILSLVTAFISPACKFISGKWIEICAADGSLQTIAVTDDRAPPEAPAKSRHKKPDSCAFCFAQTHIKFDGAGYAPFALLAFLTAALVLRASAPTRRRYELSALSARAPPRFSFSR